MQDIFKVWKNECTVKVFLIEPVISNGLYNVDKIEHQIEGSLVIVWVLHTRQNFFAISKQFEKVDIKG